MKQFFVILLMLAFANMMIVVPAMAGENKIQATPEEGPKAPATKTVAVKGPIPKPPAKAEEKAPATAKQNKRLDADGATVLVNETKFDANAIQVNDSTGVVLAEQQKVKNWAHTGPGAATISVLVIGGVTGIVLGILAATGVLKNTVEVN